MAHPTLSIQERDALLAGLKLLREQYEAGGLRFDPAHPESNPVADLFTNGGEHEGLDARGIDQLGDLIVAEYPAPPRRHREGR